MAFIAVRLASGDERYIRLSENEDAPAALRAFASKQGAYAGEWFKTTDETFVSRTGVVEAWATEEERRERGRVLGVMSF